MSLTEFIQSLILSGALGFISLNWLQSRGVKTSYLSREDANYYRIMFGVIDYVIYLLFSLLFRNYFLDPRWVMICAIVCTLIVASAFTCAYGKWSSYTMQNGHGYNRLTVREDSFNNPFGGDVQADMFQIDGQYIGSGLVHLVSLAPGLPDDVSLIPLPSECTAHKTVEEAEKEFNVCYLDISAGIRYYLIYFSRNSEEL